MKIVFFSDVHGNIYAFKQFLKSLDNENADLVIFCGDVFGYYYYPNEILNIMRERNFKVLLGNHDQFFLDILDGKVESTEFIMKYGNSYADIINKITMENIEFIKKISPDFDFNVDGIRIGVFHGTPDNPLNGRLYPDSKVIDIESYKNFDYIILGHTHHKMVKILDNTIILNPGSLGQPRDGKGCSYLVLDTANQTYDFKIVEYEIKLMVNDIRLFDPKNEKLIELVTRKK